MKINLQGAWQAAVAVLLLVLMPACDGSSSAPTHMAATTPSAGRQPCQVDGASDALEHAICTARPLAMDNALAPIGSSAQSQAELLAEALPVLERLWQADRSLGRNIPWGEITRPHFRATLVPYLARAVRNRQSQLPLKELQEVAIELSKEDIPKGFVLGIRLIGLTDAPGQVPRLKRIILNRSGDEEQRREAIEALGNLCAPEAQQLLHNLQGDERLSAKEQMSILVAFSTLQNTRKLWCDRS